MQTKLCTNGNCPQVSCLLRQLGPPMVDTGGVGILDRAENVDANPGVTAMQTNTLGAESDNEEEVMRRIIEESRRLAYSFKFCGMVMSDEESLQLHNVNCGENGNEWMLR